MRKIIRFMKRVAISGLSTSLRMWIFKYVGNSSVDKVICGAWNFPGGPGTLWSCRPCWPVSHKAKGRTLVRGSPLLCCSYINLNCFEVLAYQISLILVSNPQTWLIISLAFFCLMHGYRQSHVEWQGTHVTSLSHARFPALKQNISYTSPSYCVVPASHRWLSTRLQ